MDASLIICDAELWWNAATHAATKASTDFRLPSGPLAFGHVGLPHTSNCVSRLFVSGSAKRNSKKCAAYFFERREISGGAITQPAGCGGDKLDTLGYMMLPEAV